MIDIKSLPEFTGFTVYDAKTGDAIELSEAMDDEYKFFEYGKFALDEDGDLIIHAIDAFGGHVVAHPDHGKFIIQLGTGEMYKW